MIVGGDWNEMILFGGMLTLDSCPTIHYDECLNGCSTDYPCFSCPSLHDEGPCLVVWEPCFIKCICGIDL